MATHDIDLAYGWADEVTVVDGGAVVRQGRPDWVLRDRALLSAARLRVPWVLGVVLRLCELGHLTGPAPLPRTPAELLARLQSGFSGGLSSTVPPSPAPGS